MHDVLVVGGGLAGTMAAIVAAERGLDAVWIADEVGPDAQSARWHAHVHRGRLYDPVREADLIAELQINASFWWSDPVRRFHTGTPTVAIGPDRAWADGFRRVLEGDRDEDVAPSYLRADAVAVRTDEAILDGPRFIAAARAVAASRVSVVRGRCVALRGGDAQWSARVRTSSGEEEARARSVVLATGIDIDELVPSGTRLDHPYDTRLSRMLVLRGRLPRAAAIVPSRASGGLFFASREVRDRPGERVWLVSDGFNSPGSVSPGALTDAWWACSITERLYGYVREPLLDGARAAAYVAPKSRLAASPTQVPARGISVDAGARLVALIPSKGSASPSAAVDALSALHPDPMPLRDRLLRLARTLETAPRAGHPLREQWEDLDPSVPLRELREPGIDALDAGAALFGAERARAMRRSDSLAARRA